MSTVMQERTGYEPLRTLTVVCRAKLPAELWRAVSVAEQPPEHGENFRAVDVTDGGVRVTVLPKRQYDALIERVEELERWLTEFLREEEIP